MWYNCSFLDNNYAVNELGQVRRNESFGTDGRRIKEHLLKPYKQNNNYQVVDVMYRTKKLRFLVHRLVYCTINNIDINSKLVVHHKDHNRCNNCLTNLELLTQSDNILEYTRSGRYKPLSKEQLKLNSQRLRECLRKPIQMINMYDLTVAEEFEATMDVKRKYGYDISLIGTATKNFTKRSAYGYYWKYISK